MRAFVHRQSELVALVLAVAAVVTFGVALSPGAAHAATPTATGTPAAKTATPVATVTKPTAVATVAAPVATATKAAAAAPATTGKLPKTGDGTALAGSAATGWLSVAAIATVGGFALMFVGQSRRRPR